MDGSLAANATNKEIRLADYESPAFLVSSVDLLFLVEDNKVIVEAKSLYKRERSSQKDLRLHGSPYFALKSIMVDGVQVADSDYQVDDELLLLKDVPDEFSLEIVTELKPAENTRLEGLYESGGNLCTQCEAEGFRHITYFQDRPDVLASYCVRIEADKRRYPVLLSNGNLEEQGDLADGRHFAVWRDPHPKPCYLFAVVAGQLVAQSDQFVTKSGHSIDLNIYVREADIDKCDHAMQSLKRSMKWDEDVYGLEYDLNVYNIVAVSDFNMGAMENKGLNIFNTKYVLASGETATDTDFDNVEGVIGHEYFHNWTGNRVTCRDWFQLSLKEGLTVYRDQEFSADMGSRAVKRIQDVRLLRLLQFPEDAGPLAHPVRPESYIEINNFYTTTIYNKGAEVIRMMSRILGDVDFKKGIAHYLEAHDGCAATCEDFVLSMELASGADLSQFRHWYSQAGTPEIECSRAWQNGQMVLTIKQKVPDTPGQKNKKPMQLPLGVAWFDQTGTPVDTDTPSKFGIEEGTIYLDVKEEEQQFTFSNCPEEAVPSLLRGFSAPIHLHTDLTDRERSLLFQYDTDSFARWQAGQELYSSQILRQAENLEEDYFSGEVTQSIIAAMAGIIDNDKMDPAYAAELLSVPSEVILGQEQSVLDPEGLHTARTRFLSLAADQNWQTMLDRVRKLQTAENQEEKLVKGGRRLKNTLLEMMSHSLQYRAFGAEMVEAQFDSAQNMTDQFAALSIICDRSFSCKAKKLEEFYQQWQAHDLVVDKWFAVQAQSPDASAKGEMNRLMCHPAFSLKNPNRLRSLVSIFAMSNQLNFHAKDGSGYNFLSDVIASVDSINPQTAARMLAPLGRWMRLDESRRKLMKKSVASLLEKSELSNDVKEMAEKSLRTV
ncbi:MAG: aminopeptidase N [Kordiimonadaceae bacterium]|nr:aminopeptidase N [Kordiimonadaceae bacterium]MBO6570694.1 aminopeptidase N [Kordiimonadaceae bacterium]MBO6966448.1 aminopeptidase N [Kordiimonadaceae bacterium]